MVQITQTWTNVPVMLQMGAKIDRIDTHCIETYKKYIFYDTVISLPTKESITNL